MAKVKDLLIGTEGLNPEANIVLSKDSNGNLEAVVEEVKEKEYTLITADGTRIEAGINPCGIDKDGNYNIMVSITPRVTKDIVFKASGTERDKENTLSVLVELLGESVSTINITEDTKVSELFEPYMFKCNGYEAIAESSVVHNMVVVRAMTQDDGWDGDIFKTGQVHSNEFFSVNWDDDNES